MSDPTARVVLIVEDDPDLRENLRQLLEGEGFRVRTASNRDEAAARLSTDRIAVILADYLLPEGDGLQVLRDARAHHPNIHGILMTAFDEGYIRAGAVRAEGFEFIKKPFEAEEMLSLVRRLGD